MADEELSLLEAHIRADAHSRAYNQVQTAINNMLASTESDWRNLNFVDCKLPPTTLGEALKTIREYLTEQLSKRNARDDIVAFKQKVATMKQIEAAKAAAVYHCPECEATVGHNKDCSHYGKK